MSRERLGKYMIAEKLPQMAGRKTSIWQILSARHGELLATVRWQGSWRQYVAQPAIATVFNSDCLRDLAGFLERENAEHKAQRKGGGTGARLQPGRYTSPR